MLYSRDILSRLKKVTKMTTVIASFQFKIEVTLNKPTNFTCQLIVKVLKKSVFF